MVGARALIGGSRHHLLFITRSSNNIDVIDLQSFEYLENIKNNILPVSDDNEVWYHCFVKNDVNKKKKEKNERDEFILMSNGETLLIEYDEIKNEFFYQQLSSFHSPFKGLKEYAFAYWKHCIFIFGGYDNNQYERIDSIWKFDMKEKNWKECNIKIPIAIDSAVAVVRENDSLIHTIGGYNDKKLDTHYVMIVV